METKKRFTDINKWRDPWFQELSQEAKLLWLFIWDDCSPIGLYRYYPSGIIFHTGMPKKEIPSLEIFNDPSEKLVKQDHLGKNIYLIKDYIDFQYSGKKGNGLSVVNAAHYGYLNEIRDKGLWGYYLTYQKDVIAPKSIEYFYAVDSGKIDNTGKPSKRDIESLDIDYGSIPDEYFKSDYGSTLSLNRPKNVTKEKETDIDKGKEEKKDESPIHISDNDFKEIKKYLNDEETIEFIFKNEIKRICEALDNQVSLPLSTIKRYSQKLKKSYPYKANTIHNLIDILKEDNLNINETPF